MAIRQSHAIRVLDPSRETFGSIIGSDLEISGRIVATKSLRIDGTIIGDVHFWFAVNPITVLVDVEECHRSVPKKGGKVLPFKKVVRN